MFVLDVDVDTLHRRLDQRPPDEWGGQPALGDLIVRLHTTREDVPRTGVGIDSTRPLDDVVDEILRLAGAAGEAWSASYPPPCHTAGRSLAQARRSHGRRIGRANALGAKPDDGCRSAVL